MTPETVPSLLSRQPGSETFRRFQQLFAHSNPSSIRLNVESSEAPNRSKVEVSTLVANCALERAIIRKTSSAGQPDCYSGGWYQASGLETDQMLTEQEATALYQRLFKDVEVFLRRELALNWQSELAQLFHESSELKWEVDEHHRSKADPTTDLIGYTVSTTRLIDGLTGPYEFSLEATIHEDVSKLDAKLTLSRNGFSTFCHLKDQEVLNVLSTVCQTLELNRFGIEEPPSTRREMCR